MRIAELMEPVNKMNIILSSIGALKNHKESARITLLLLANELQWLGHDVRVIAKGSEIERIQGLTIHKTSLLKIPWLLHQLNREKKIEIVHSFSATPLFVISSWIGKLGSSTKIVHTLKSYSRTTWGNWGYPFLNLAQKVTLPTLEFKKRLHLMQKNKICIIPSPIDTTKFHPYSKSELRKKYGYGSENIIFYYGALWEQKGVNDLITAVASLSPQIKLIIAPRYTQIQSQQEMVQRLNLNNVSFLFDIPIEEYVALADIVVLPYKNLEGTEGNPSCMLEAMASKTLVVTTDLPELREIGEGCVLFAQPSDPQSLAETISKALSMTETEIKPLLDKAYEKSKEFDSRKIAQKFIELYHSVL